MTKLWAAITEALQAGEIESIHATGAIIEITLSDKSEPAPKPERKPRKPRNNGLAETRRIVGAQETGQATAAADIDLDIPAHLRRT